MNTAVTIPANVMVATPSYGGVLTTGYVHGLLDLYDTADQHQFGLKVNFNSFESLITRARNTMVAEFLADSRFTHLMWIDGDIGFKGSDIVRLLLADRPVAAGVYPLKTEGWPAGGLPEALPAGTAHADFRDRFAQYPTTFFRNVQPDESGFVEVLDVPTGFMLIRRDVFMGLANAFPQLQYRPGLVDRPDHNSERMAALHYGFFDTMIDPESRSYLSEDYAFCRRIAQLGIRPVVDTRSNLTHQGTAIFRGDLGRSLARHHAAKPV